MAITITKPIDEHRADYTATANQMASDKITAKYPLYKQLNVARTPDAEAMNTWIDVVRAIAQAAKTEINVAPSIVEIRAAVSEFKSSLELL
jgi:hypothetical protein